MYRDYEDPYVLEEKLRALREKHREALEEAEKLAEQIEDLAERVRFAWADQEADEFDY